MADEKQDLRVLRTRRSIRKAFSDMVMELEYPDITVKELAQRAMINRNTFYLHYDSIGNLAEELQNELAETFLSMYTSYDTIEDVQAMVRRYMEYLTSHSPLVERVFFCDSYRFIADKIHAKIVARRKQKRRDLFGMDEHAEDLVLSYCESVGTSLFRQWVADGKQLPVEDLIELAIKLICHGMGSVIRT